MTKQRAHVLPQGMTMSEVLDPGVASTAAAGTDRPLPSPPPPSRAGSSPAALATALLGAAALAGCGGGAGLNAPPVTAGSGPAPAPAPSAPQPTQAQAARFLGQAGFAANSTDMGTITSTGYQRWLDNQFAMAVVKPSAWSWVQAQAVKNTQAYLDFSIWRRLISSPDQLRQRVVLALSEIFVISTGQLNGVTDPASLAAAFWDTLEQNAFGTFRQLLQAVSLSGAMGSFLNMRGSIKVNPKTGGQPDENYAREVMQLFTIGLVQLNPDGTSKLDANKKEIYTYAQEQVTAFAAVLTGWNFDLAKGVAQADDPGFATRPMVNDPTKFSTGDKDVLGTAIPASVDGPTALGMALDVLSNHPNNGPFVGRQLIQHLVSSNPSPAYVSRVSAVFNNNGKGVRGDMRAVINAVLMDPEARTAPQGLANGKLREPIVRFVQWARTFGLASPEGLWDIGNLSDPGSRLGQSPLRAPSVFNFFAPDYVPSNSKLGDNAITAPEFQIYTETTVAGYLNFMQSVIQYGLGGGTSGSVTGSKSSCTPNYAGELTYASDPASLVARYNLLLAGGGLGADTIATITDAVTNVKVDSTNPNPGLNNRVWAAIFLVMAAPDYLIQQ
ncbi:MAG: DUF1800 domain-containing protein [Rhodanobacter sp.]